MLFGDGDLGVVLTLAVLAGGGTAVLAGIHTVGAWQRRRAVTRLHEPPQTRRDRTD